ncbi:efflux transporter outer membrane subunit [Pseudomonas sp. LBUM920]|uniref:efflux transporter outer membrane subunit n=1 Tax=Pseudomonas sp. LBUM920 TaxID=2126069 RepID=UPI000F58A41C|nr:TolC family protein [Pseudomonas sp. LBUM920]AZF63044.1 Outer membrane component of tripartite multidrug resistance system [Pseudomonas sp. LBUM920]
MPSSVFDRFHRLAIVGVISALAGCSNAPTTRVTAQPAAILSLETAEPLPARWWQLYRDPQLDALVERALRENKHLEAAGAHVDAMLALLQQVEGQRRPSTELSYGLAYGRSRDDQTLAQATGQSAGGQWSHTPEFALSYTLDLWGAVRYRIAAAHADAQAARAVEDELRVTVAAQTARAYAQACVYAHQAQVQRDSVRLLARSLDVTQRLQKAGAANELEVARLQGLLEETRAPLALFAARRQSALYELAVLSGQPPEQVSAHSCQQGPRLQAPLPVGEGWALVQRRPDIRRAQAQVRAATAAIGLARAQVYPQITFGAMLGSSAASLGKLGDANAVVYGIGPLLSWQFPNRQIALAQVTQRRAEAHQALAQFDATVLDALKQVEQALVLYQGEQQRRQALVAALAHSRRAFDLANRSFLAGGLDTLALLDSERNRVSLETRLAQADLHLINRQIDLFQALGGGWQRPDPSPSLPVATLGARR